MVAVSSEQEMKVHICAWCKRTMINGVPVEYAGDIAELDSHGICLECMEKYFGAALSEADSGAAVVENIEVGGVAI